MGNLFYMFPFYNPFGALGFPQNPSGPYTSGARGYILMSRGVDLHTVLTVLPFFCPFISLSRTANTHYRIGDWCQSPPN